MSPNGEKSPSSTKALPAHRSLGLTDEQLLSFYG